MNRQAILKLIEAHRQLLAALQAQMDSLPATESAPVPQKTATASQEFISEEEDAMMAHQIEQERLFMQRQWDAQQMAHKGLEKVFEAEHRKEEEEPLSPALGDFIKRHGADPLKPSDFFTDEDS